MLSSLSLSSAPPTTRHHLHQLLTPAKLTHVTGNHKLNVHVLLDKTVHLSWSDVNVRGIEANTSIPQDCLQSTNGMSRCDIFRGIVHLENERDT